MADVNQAGESMAGEYRPCRHCQVAVLQPTRRGQVKDFCSDRHRAAYRDGQVQAGIRKAQEAIVETREEIATTIATLEQLDAKLVGAGHLLDRGLRHGRRTRKTHQEPAGPQPDLSKALETLKNRRP